ncbi:TonB-dependent receptor [Chitinophaga nivalis]|uniref:TonB-dependent receptor n=1 Tax=Chitinophaga nivalis TaxID=2991709 RepID=A0ABT3IVM6_9BACT|nr:TonB-dependent receptor [Chitinophaga nivalis]MCW3462292.1 TonB-dependent receptor [Chitinophaga nivalis]MCW3488017.1 TonB-dependent receptor [Chitinophaga nivalis]
MMKMTGLLIFGGFLQVSATTYAQDRISELHAENKSVREVFKLIENNTNYRFFYNENFSDLNRAVTISVKDKKINDVLGLLFSSSNVTYRVLDNNLVVITPVGAAQIKVTGFVTDAVTKDPLPGVTVAVEGTSIGAVTDATGKFTLQAPAENGTLVFSYIGYILQKVAIGGRSEINIKLEPDTKKLEEVVVMGYTTTTTKNLTGAAQAVSAVKLKDVTATSVDKMLQGKVSGVFVGNGSGDPSAAPVIRIRGNGTLTAGNAPLVVVDGIIGGLPNPSDIETVTILKDAAATTLYGARAANGVMVITTKRGKAGKTQVNFRTNIGTAQLNTGRFHLMNSASLYDLQKAAGNDLDPALRNVGTNWEKLAFQNASNQNYELSTSGGNEKTKFYLGGNYYKEDGILRGTGVERFSARLNLDHNITDRLRVSANFAGVQSSNRDNNNGSLYQYPLNMPWDKPYNAAGKPVNPAVIDEWYGRDRSNFLFDQQYNYNKDVRQTLEGLLKLEYDITKWLVFSTTNRAQYYHYRNESNGDLRTAAGADDRGNLYNSYQDSVAYISSNLLKARYTFNKVHNIDGLVGAEFQQVNLNDINAKGKGILDGKDVLDVTSTPLKIGGTKTDRAFNSYFIQANYNYNYKYYFTSSFRRDGSSRFGANKQYGNFYAFGATWAASEETFIKNIKAISNLKIRASYGTTGNAEIVDYNAIGAYAVNTQYNGYPGAYPSIYNVPDLSWEKSYSTNIGFDLGLFNRINLTVDLYQKDNKDLLFNVPLPGTAGYAYILRNIGSVRNKGIEINLSTDNLVGEFKWSTDFNIGFNKNSIQDLYGGKDYITDPLSSYFILEKGQDMRSFYQRKWLGVDPATGTPLWEKLIKDDKGNVVGSTATGVYNEASLQITGSASPKFFGGIRNVWSYKNFQLSAFISFVSGNKVYNTTRELMDNDGAYFSYNMMELDKKWTRWQQPGDNATHPQYKIGGNKEAHKPSSRFLEDGSYLRLRNVNLSYTLPKEWLNRMRVNNVRISAGGDNLWTLTRFSGIDPETDDRGISNNRYPYSTKWFAGLEINF